MDKTAKNFLMQLIKTDSPSGSEESLQKVWLNYVKKFAKISTDPCGNAIGVINEKAKFKVLLAGHCDEIALVVNRIDSNGFIYFSTVGGIATGLLPGLRVDILGYKKKVSGVIGYNRSTESNRDKIRKCEELFIDCGFNSDKELKKLVRAGDYIVYRGEPEILNKKMLIAKALDNKTGAFIVAEVLKNLSKKNINVGCYAVSTTGEETNMRGAHFAAARIEPDIAIACDVTFNTDTPNEAPDKRPEVFLGKGPALSTGSPINKKIISLLEDTAKSKKIPLQYELTVDRTYTDADKMLFSGRGVPVALVSLPLRYMHSPIEMADIDDIENVIKLLTETISKLTGKEDFLPVTI